VQLVMLVPLLMLDLAPFAVVTTLLLVVALVVATLLLLLLEVVADVDVGDAAGVTAAVVAEGPCVASGESGVAGCSDGSPT